MSPTINLICISLCILEGIHLVEKQMSTELGMQWLQWGDIFWSADVSLQRFHVSFCSQTDDAEGNVDKSDTTLDFLA